jgi:hypothetical protein
MPQQARLLSLPNSSHPGKNFYWVFSKEEVKISEEGFHTVQISTVHFSG